MCLPGIPTVLLCSFREVPVTQESGCSSTAVVPHWVARRATAVNGRPTPCCLNDVMREAGERGGTYLSGGSA